MISSTPVIQQVSVPRQVCGSQQVQVQRPNSGAGAALGAIAGGAIGAATGRGREGAAAAVVGAIGGAVIGNAVEGTPPLEERTVQNCVVQNVYENRTVAYNVVYEFAGKQYAVQMPSDPGPKIALQVMPAGSTFSGSANAPASPPAPVYAPAPVVITQQVEPYYYVRPYYPPPVMLEFGYGYWGWGHHHRDWR